MMKFIAIMSMLCVISHVQAGETLKNVKKKGFIQCGVSTGLPGLSYTDGKNEWRGLDVDICRAMATAIFGDPSKVKFTPLSAQQRFTALQSGEIDVLSRNTTFTLGRDTSQGLNFGPVVFYDGQGFMVRKKDKLKSPKDLDGASICTQQGTTTELNLADFFNTNKMKLKPVVYESNEEVVQAFLKGRCDAYTTDTTGLFAEFSRLKDPENYMILPQVISKEPLAPAVRHGDDEWYDILTWTVYALIDAEEMGISSSTVDQMLKSENPNVRRFLGVAKGNGKALGLDEKWAYNIIKKVGNYGEIFSRHLGKDSKLGMERGLNQLWKDGGIMYAPPVR